MKKIILLACLINYYSHATDLCDIFAGSINHLVTLTKLIINTTTQPKLSEYILTKHISKTNKPTTTYIHFTRLNNQKNRLAQSLLSKTN